LVGAAFAVIALLAPSAAQASGGGDGCSPGRGDDGVDYHVAWTGQPNNLPAGGVYARLYNYSPWVNPDGSVSAYTMLKEWDSRPSNYAQAGWLELPYGERHDFVEIGYDTGSISSSSYTRWEFSPQPINASTYYTTLYNPKTKQLSFQIASKTVTDDNVDYTQTLNTQYHTMSDDEQIKWIPHYTEVSGETHTAADQMPGGLNNPMDFSHVATYDSGIGHFVSYGSQWNSFDNNNTSFFNGAIYAQDHFQIGDKNCSY
jgi:hypothetical protein